MSINLEYAKAKLVFDKILAIDVESLPVTTEHLYRDDLAAAVRALLKSRRINSREVSVTKPRGSMVYWVDITLPYIDNGLTWADFNRMTAEEKEAFFEGNKPKEEHRNKAWKHMREVMEAAFPGNCDNSDVMIDYFSFSWTVQ